MVLVIALLTAAWSAEVTDIPPGMAGDVCLTYQGSIEQGSLQESLQTWGSRRVEQHDLLVDVEFSPVGGFVLRLGLEATPARLLSFPEAVSMSYDPVTETGTMVSGSLLTDPPTYEAKGVQGVWIGAALAPFSEQLHEHQQVSWRLDAAIRPGAKRSWWVHELDGPRGVAPGGVGVDLRAAFSTERGTANPYLVADYRWEGPFTAALSGGSGEEVQVRPSSSVQALAGVELVGARDEARSTKAAFDLRLRFAYLGWADIPSGVLLPDTLDATQGLLVTSGEHLELGGGLAIKGHVHRNLVLRAGADLAYVFTYRLEHLYPVYTGLDTFRIGWSAALEGRYR